MMCEIILPSVNAASDDAYLQLFDLRIKDLVHEQKTVAILLTMLRSREY